MNNTETSFSRFSDEAEGLANLAEAMNDVLAAITVLSVIDADLLDFLAVEVTKEQVARAASQPDCD